MNLIARIRRSLLRAADVIPERLVTDWPSDVAAGPLPADRTARSESVCQPRSACECGSPFGCGDASQSCGEGSC